MMRNITFSGALPKQTKLRIAEGKDLTGNYASIVLAVGGGLFFLLAGFFLLVIFTVSGGHNAAMNYTGITSLVVAFVFFGVSAHFMDKSDENKRSHKRAVIEKFNQK